MTREQYNEWRNHPATLFFRQFLKDRRDDLIHSSTEAWLNGSPVFERENQVDRGRIAELYLIESVPFEAIEAFYQEKEENAAEITETVLR